MFFNEFVGFSGVYIGAKIRDISKLFLPEIPVITFFISILLGTLVASCIITWIFTYPRVWWAFKPTLLKWSQQTAIKRALIIIGDLLSPETFKDYGILLLVLIGIIYFWFYVLLFVILVFIGFNGIVLKFHLPQLKSYFQSYKAEAQFPFEALPFMVKQRFYELQSPLTKFLMSKAKRNFFILNWPYPGNFNGLITVNNLKFGPRKYYEGVSFPMFSDEYKLISSKHQHYTQLLTCYITILSSNMEGQIRVLDEVVVKMDASKKFTALLSSSHFDFSFLKGLKVEKVYSNELLVLKELNLKYISLTLPQFNETSFMEEVVNVFDAIVGIPKIRLHFYNTCNNEAIVTEFLTQWCIKRGYLDELYLTCYINDTLITFTTEKCLPNRYWPY